MEQAPILAAMKVTGHQVIDGYTFFQGTIDGQPVVDVRSGEKEYAAEFASMLLDMHFHPRADLLSGTAGARNPNVKVGDVVLGAYVVDKSSIHYYNNGSETPYTGVEMMVNANSLTKNALVGGLGAEGPTPSDAKSYGYGPSATNKHYVYYTALPGSLGLLQSGLQAPMGTVSEKTITGSATAQGVVQSRVIAGAVGSANQWTEPLVWMADQNALYQTDTGENEGMGFAYVNAELGVPSLVVRGISDSAWYPSVYDGVLASDRAAAVTSYIVGHLPSAKALVETADFSDLSPLSNAREHGYLVANRVYYAPGGAVTKIVYTNQQGKTVTQSNPSTAEYQLPTASKS